MSYALTAKEYLFTNKCPRFISHWANFACCIGMIHQAQACVWRGCNCRWRVSDGCCTSAVCVHSPCLSPHTQQQSRHTCGGQRQQLSGKRGLSIPISGLLSKAKFCSSADLHLIEHHCLISRGSSARLTERAEELPVCAELEGCACVLLPTHTHRADVWGQLWAAGHHTANGLCVH